MATFGDVRAYVAADRWTEEPNLARRRRRTGDLWRYAKRLADGRILRTRVSHAVRDEIGADLFRHILRDQLEVDEPTFWAVVRGARSEPTPPVSRPAPLSAWLVQRLLSNAGLREEDVAAMTLAEAQAAWADHPARRQP